MLEDVSTLYCNSWIFLYLDLLSGAVLHVLLFSFSGDIFTARVSGDVGRCITSGHHPYNFSR